MLEKVLPCFRTKSLRLALMGVSLLTILPFSNGIAANTIAKSDAVEDAAPAKVEPAETEIIPFRDESPLLAVRKGNPTSPLEIAALFHKRAGTEPDFRLWAEKNEAYEKALAIDKKAVFVKVYNEIVKRFRELPEDSLINVQPVINLGEYSELQSIQVFDSFHEDTYFGYDANGENYAIIPQNLKRFHHIEMSPQRHEELATKNGRNHQVRGEIILKITQTETEKPYDLNEEKPFWLIAADIAELRLWTMNKEEPRLLWRYQAPWYNGGADSELLKLYDNSRNSQ